MAEGAQGGLVFFHRSGTVGEAESGPLDFVREPFFRIFAGGLGCQSR